jgi:sugar lactone lactonase YvrE
MRIGILTAGLAGAMACGGGDQAESATPIVVETAGLQTPESVLHDATADVYLVSNINGGPLDKDDNGFIARITPAGRVTELRWIDGADEAVTLHAPKGMAIIGDTLFVTDIDVVRLFHRVSGDPLGERAVAGATFLNDLAAGPAGTLYVTDTGLKAGAEGFEDSGTDAVYRYRNGQWETVASGPGLGRPNGLAVTSEGITVVTFGSGAVYRLDPATGARTDLPMPEQGQLDGVVALADGSLLISSWRGEAVFRLLADGTYVVAADSLPAPADLGVDAERQRVLVPLFTQHKVVIRSL